MKQALRIGFAQSPLGCKKDPAMGGRWNADGHQNVVLTTFTETFTWVDWDGIEVKEDALDSIIS